MLSYETYAPWTQQFGVRTEGGNWTGLVGAIQFNIADFSTIVAPTRERFEVIDTTRVYLSDVLSVVSLKPDLIPQYLVIVKPFAGDVWMYLVVSIFIWGITLWLFQKIWASYSGGSAMSLSRAIFYSWAVILDDPPLKPPQNTTARILLGFWLIATFVATTGFRSALVAHLGVQGKTKPIDSFKDMVGKKNYKWGIEAYYLTGLPLIYFQTTADPVVKEVYKHIEPLENNEIAFEKIMKGNYALITFELRAHTIINSYYTDDYGNTPYYVSKEGYSLVPYFGWGYGKGTPFRDRFGMIQARLGEAGIIDYWTKDVIALRVRTNRKETNTGTSINRIPGEQTIKLRVIHLVGVFLLFLLGSVVAFLVFLGERIVSPNSKTSHM
ncbi:glutamate receptor ionotropic, kainate glr-3-like [Palaemon carinicauda]|uniref:glutamate receptor ionotropic, kainate glr-3-like n=1 Tax=Palaemon carinicauda TaxID=392227 RepID=UPI0035B64FC2